MLVQEENIPGPGVRYVFINDLFEKEKKCLAYRLVTDSGINDLKPCCHTENHENVDYKYIYISAIGSYWTVESPTQANQISC